MCLEFLQDGGLLLGGEGGEAVGEDGAESLLGTEAHLHPAYLKSAVVGRVGQKSPVEVSVAHRLGTKKGREVISSCQRLT